MNQNLINPLNVVLADTYALYLKTQAYHWHVKGPEFYALHKLFEEQYQSLAAAIDEMAELIIILGGQALSSFSAYQQHTRIKEPTLDYSSEAMLRELADDHGSMIKNLQKVMVSCEEEDGATADFLIGRIESHRKMCWMLSASVK